MIKQSRSRIAFNVLNTCFMLFVILVTLYPFLYVISISFSSVKMVMQGKISFYPKEITLSSYKLILAQKSFWQGYQNTIVYTLSGTLLSLIMTILCAYPLSKKWLPGRSFLMTYIIITMFVGGGLIPTYLLVKSLHLTNTIWSVILPGAISTYNMIIMRTFFQGQAVDLEEAASIDGLGPFGILIRIVLPLSKAIIATIGLFTAVGYWNNWFTPFIYMNSQARMPVTVFLRNLLYGATVAAREGALATDEDFTDLAMTAKSVTIVLIITPILCVYPFVQKYFVKGVMIGSLKG